MPIWFGAQLAPEGSGKQGEWEKNRQARPVGRATLVHLDY
jgi:hypothetical protein